MSNNVQSVIFNSFINIFRMYLPENNRLLAGTKITLAYEQEKLKKLYIPKNAYAITPIRGYQASLIDSNQVGDSLRFNDKMEGTSL